MYLCIDIGGTKTIVALLDNSGKILHFVRFATLPSQDAFLSSLKQQISANFTLENLRAISLAFPGNLKRGRIESLANLPWRNFDLKKSLQAISPNTPIFLANDANLAGLAEADSHANRSLYFTFSTGIGGAVVENGQIPKKYQIFEPGHNFYVYKGQKVEWESIASARAIREKYNSLVEEISDPKIWNDIIDRMLLGLVPLTISIRPNRLIFGGPLGLAIDHYRPLLRSKFTTALPEKLKTPRILKAKYDHFSVIHGCYLHAKRQLQ